MSEKVRREMLEHMERVQPYDKSQMETFEKAILAADLGLNPTNDGHVIRVKVPKLSEERRAELTRVIKTRGEEAKVALRNIRREANEKLEQMKKDKEISEDEYHRYREKNDEAIHEYSEKIDGLVAENALICPVCFFPNRLVSSDWGAGFSCAQSWPRSCSPLGSVWQRPALGSASFSTRLISSSSARRRGVY